MTTIDQLGFLGKQIGAIKSGGNAITLTVGAHNDNLNVDETSDMIVYEV